MNILSGSLFRSVSAISLLACTVTGVVAPTAGVANDPGPAFDRAAWIADFDALRDAMTHNYANLEWARERGMDLASIEQRARARLQAPVADRVWFAGEALSRLQWGTAGGAYEEGTRAAAAVADRLRG